VREKEIEGEREERERERERSFITARAAGKRRKK